MSWIAGSGLPGSGGGWPPGGRDSFGGGLGGWQPGEGDPFGDRPGGMWTPPGLDMAGVGSGEPGLASAFGIGAGIGLFIDPESGEDTADKEREQLDYLRELTAWVLDFTFDLLFTELTGPCLACRRGPPPGGTPGDPAWRTWADACTRCELERLTYLRHLVTFPIPGS